MRTTERSRVCRAANEAEEEGAQLLHAVCWKAAVEGNVEPIYWQGQIIGEVRKYDTRLQIEMLRAYMPDKFKTPGSHAPVISGDNNNKVMIMTPERQDELIRIRREALEAMRPKPIEGRPNGRSSDSGNSPGSVQ